METKAVYKYQLTGDNLTIRVPVGGVIISNDIESGVIYLWILINNAPNILSVERSFFITETGQSFTIHDDEQFIFVNTFQTHHNHIIHLFEIVKNQL